MFALKLKKKLNETTAQLQNTEQDKNKLEKILSEQYALQSDCKSKDEVDNKEHEKEKPEIVKVETKVKTAGSAESPEKILIEMKKFKGMVIIHLLLYFMINLKCVLA